MSVIVNAGVSESHLRHSLRSLVGQTWPASEVLVVHIGRIDEIEAVVTEELPDLPLTLVAARDEQLAPALNEAVAAATGRHLAFLDAADSWEPDRLSLLVDALRHVDSPMVADVMRSVAKDGSVNFAVGGHPEGGVTSRFGIDLGRIVIDTEAVADVGGFDPTMRGAWSFDLVVRLSRAHPITVLPTVGVHRNYRERHHARRPSPRYRPVTDHVAIASWADVSLNRHLVDWEALARKRQDPATISVIIPTYEDWRLTEGAVRSVLASDPGEGRSIDCIVWDNGSSAAVHAVLASLKVRYPEIRLEHSPVNHGFALGNNLAVPYARGDTIVFLNNDVEVPPDWLTPITRALADEGVLGVQPLLVYPSGAVQSAGVAFPSTGGLPHAFLQGFPPEDASKVGDLRFSALTGAALALRFSDVVALNGFDPIFTNGMEDVDLCHRLSRMRDGYFRVLPDAPVMHCESRSPGRYTKYLLNRQVYLDRWRGVLEPRDDVRLWAACGYRVLDHEVIRKNDLVKRHLVVPAPVLVRERRLHVDESPERLRWAIKNPAPYGPESERWGDTHFARAVAAALRGLGQEVVIDHRAEFERTTSRHDDVSLVLRGLAPFSPSAEQVSIAWVISHPEMLGRPEAETYDRVVAASVCWAEQTSRAWGFHVEPLLQATDPQLFHPDRAVADTGHPVIFVGSSRKVYRTVVKDAVEAGLPVSVYGGLWGRFIPKQYIKGEYLDNLTLGEAYRSAGVVLNDHWEDMRTSGFISNRLFDAAASGARVITDAVEGLPATFGDSVQVYRSQEDLVRLSSLADPDEVFGDDAARRQVAAKVSREHSFHARAQRLVEIALEERRRRGFSA